MPLSTFTLTLTSTETPAQCRERKRAYTFSTNTGYALIERIGTVHIFIYTCISMYISYTRFAFSLIFLCGFYFHSCRSDGSPVQIHKWRPITSTFTNIWTCIKKNYFLLSCSLCIVFMLLSLLPVVVVVVVVALASFFECASVNVDHETKKIFSM